MNDPRVSENILQRQAGSRIVNKKLCDEIPCSRRDVRREGEVHCGDAAESGALALGLEGRSSSQELVRQHSQGPDIDTGVMRLAFYHLGRKVIKGSTHGLTAKRGRMNRPTKICQFHLTLES